MEEIKKLEVKCPKCGHQFLTRGQLILVTCNGCGKKIKRLENLVKPTGQRKIE